MPFRFPFETLLRLRRSVEAHQEMLLIAANQRVVAQHRQIEQTDLALRERETRRLDALTEGLSGAQLHFELSCRAVLEQHKLVLEGELRRLEILRAQQQERFQQARRQRESLEQLREHAWRAFLREEDRLEQRRLDDLFLLRREFKKRG